MTATTIVNILNLTPLELKSKFKGAGFEPYRADQILSWIYDKGVYDFEIGRKFDFSILIFYTEG